MKLQKSYLIRAFLITSALLLFVSPPGYCAQKNISSIINLLLDNRRPTMEETVTKASANLGGPVNAAFAFLSAADRGYSWIQIVDAIEVGNLQEDGSIPGISPEDDPQGIITVSEKSLMTVENTSLFTVSMQPLAYDPGSIIGKLGEFSDPEDNVLAAIVDLVCNGYSLEQIIEGIMANTIRVGGWIACLPPDDENPDCYYGGERLAPLVRGGDETWSNCLGPGNPWIRGKWQQPGYFAVIVPYGYKSYTLTGSGPGNFLHTGIIHWYKTNNWYEGNLRDVDGYCCGNVGYIWVKVKDENTISIKSYWTTPEGDLVKDNTKVWTDMTLYSRDTH